MMFLLITCLFILVTIMNNEKARKIAKKRDEVTLAKYGFTYSMVESSFRNNFQCPECHGQGVVRIEDFNPETTQYIDDEIECDMCEGKRILNKDELLNKLA
jgi:excinuclease UvrABC ATPase subunit